MRNGIGRNVDKIVGILKEYAGSGLTLVDLVMLSGLFSSDISDVFDELEDSGKLCVKSNGSSRIYNLKK